MEDISSIDLYIAQEKSNQNSDKRQIHIMNIKQKTQTFQALSLLSNRSFFLFSRCFSRESFFILKNPNFLKVASILASTLSLSNS